MTLHCIAARADSGSAPTKDDPAFLARAPSVNTPAEQQQVQLKGVSGLHPVTKCCLSEPDLIPYLNTMRLTYAICDTQSQGS